MLTDKVAVVTGASRGIGKEIARTLASQGAVVIVNYCGSAAKAEETVGEIRENGGAAEAVQCDVSDFAKAGELMDYVIKKYGRLDILVNNAGVSDSTKVDDYDPVQFEKVMKLNVNAIFYAVQPAVKIMKEQGGGCILNTSSMVSISGQPRELGPSNIRVNAVAPGVTKTDMVAALPDAMIQPLIQTIPLRRVGEPEEVANAFLFLASDMASYVTGEVLSVDGAARA